MKHIYIIQRFLLVLITAPFLASGQKSNSSPSKMLRIYEDNDYINIRGKGTDEAYTNGTRIDFFYSKPKKPRLLIDRVLPNAGQNSINLLGWGITQLMFTPKDLCTRQYQPNDYPYSGALYLTHGAYSYNTVKKTCIQTVLMAGVRGPSAFAAQTQTFIHRLISYQQPMGWGNQLKNKLILNIKITAEKQLFAYRNSLEILGGGEIHTGTFLNAASIYTAIRVGKMNPYFNGLITQYTSTKDRRQRSTKNMQAYLQFKPGLTLTASNAMLQSGKQHFNEVEGKNEKTGAIKNSVWTFDGTAVLSINRFGISFTQNITSALVKHLYNHEVGNISLYFGL